MANLTTKIPNWLTYLRLVLIPILVLLLMWPTAFLSKIAAVIFVIAALTDYFDGVLARRYQATTDTGKLLDPLADKILVMSALVMLVAARGPDDTSWVPAWMVVLLLGREMWINGLRSIAATKGVVLAAGFLGKIKTTLQMISIVALILHYEVQIGGIIIDMYWLGVGLLGVSLVFSLWSAWQYSQKVWKL